MGKRKKFIIKSNNRKTEDNTTPLNNWNLSYIYIN